jgi:hypothetical protein
MKTKIGHKSNRLRFEEGNVNIISKTLRAVATFIIVGNNVARVVRQLPNFKPAALGKTPPTGPYKMGELDNRIVIHDPFLADYGNNLGANRYIMGYKGDSFLTAGFAYCPYIPYNYLRHCQVIGNENSVNCWKHWSISRYDAKMAA